LILALSFSFFLLATVYCLNMAGSATAAAISILTRSVLGHLGQWLGLTLVGLSLQALPKIKPILAIIILEHFLAMRVDGCVGGGYCNFLVGAVRPRLRSSDRGPILKSPATGLGFSAP